MLLNKMMQLLKPVPREPEDPGITDPTVLLGLLKDQDGVASTNDLPKLQWSTTIWPLRKQKLIQMSPKGGPHSDEEIISLTDAGRRLVGLPPLPPTVWQRILAKLNLQSAAPQ